MKPTEKERAAQLEEIAEELDKFIVSPLYEYRVENGYSYVLGEGDPSSEVLVVGEAPGENEAKTGRPFVGAAGKILNNLLETIGMERQDVYITNIVKDRPPENRDPTQVEIDLYAPFLRRQVAIIQPKVIVTLGRFAMEFMLQEFGAKEMGRKISELHGKPVESQAPYGKIWILPLYHPAAAIYNRDLRGTLSEDFQHLKDLLSVST